MSRFVVIVSGLPGAGKTTLSSRLGQDLGFVVVCRDRVQRLFADVRSVLVAIDKVELLGAAASSAVTHFAQSVLDAGHGVVIDNNYNWAWQIDPVRRLVETTQAPAFEVRLWGDKEALRRRWAEREPELIRLPEMGPVLDAAYSKPREFVLDSRYPRLEFNATDLVELDAAYPSVLERIRGLVQSEGRSGATVPAGVRSPL